MNQRIPFLIFLPGLLYVLSGFLPPRHQVDMDIDGFSRLPVQTGGRVMPVDTAARNQLRIISGRQHVRLEEGGRMPASQWLLELAFRPEVADDLKVFRIENPEVLGLFGWDPDIGKFFSFNELQPHFRAIREQAVRVNPEAQLRTPFEKQIVQLHHALSLYNELAHSFTSTGNLSQLEWEYLSWLQAVQTGRDAFRARELGEEYDIEAFNRFAFLTDRFMELSRRASLGVIPPFTAEQREENHWLDIGQGLLLTLRTDEINPVAAAYAQLSAAYRAQDAEYFNRTLATLHAEIDPQAPLGRVGFEHFFNHFAPFMKSIVLYLAVCLIIGYSWLRESEGARRGAYWLLLLALVIHTFGLLARMYIQGRPPVTNLYASAVFTGWGAVLLGAIIERLQKNGVGTLAAGLIGFVTLIIAHNLAATGDTLEMMRAVLDSNFWLATHVIVITLGYSGVFLAGAIAIVYVLRGIFTRGLSPELGRSLTRMVYGVTCFGLLFSFVGTMLGGVWADQSWGRFWGWDPKENGALIIVLWGALMLHARWGKLVGDRGFMLLAIGGNIVTAWSWFGTNMLGIGLHSYGFMDAAFFYLIAFWMSQLALITLGTLPKRYWRSPMQVAKAT